MVAMYNIYSEISSLMEILMNLEPILLENWHGVRMGN